MRHRPIVLTVVAAAWLLTGAPARLHGQAGQDVRLHWITNGPVSTGATLGATLYVGGSFTRVAPSANGLGAVHVLSTADGTVPRRLPLVDGEIRDVEPDGAGGVFLGGRFSSVDGVPRTSLAHLRADGSLDTDFAPAITRTGTDPVTVDAILLHDGALYLAMRCCGGVLVNGQARQALAALDPASGATLPFAPVTAPVTTLLTVDGQLTAVGDAVSVFDGNGALVRTSLLPAGRAYAAAVAGARLVVGGRFVLPGGTYHSVIALDRHTGTFDPAWPLDGESDGFAYALEVIGPTLYVGGDFTEFLAAPRHNLAALDLASGAVTSWAPLADGAVEALAPTPGGVLAGGAFLSVNAVPREQLAEIDLGGSTTAWQLSTFPTAVHDVAAVGSELIVAGRMAIVGGSVRRDYAAFDLTTDALLPWAPETPGRAPVALAAGAGAVVIGTEQADDGQPRVAAVSPDTGTALGHLTWPAPARLAGIHGAWAYVSAGADLPRGVLRRTLVATGEADGAWAMAIAPAGLVNGVLYGAVPASPPRLIAVDLERGAQAPWEIALPQVGGYAGTGDVAVDGSTAYATYSDYARPLRIAFDHRSGREVRWPAALPSPRPAFVKPPSIAAADGAVVLSIRTDHPGQALTARTADGHDAVWPLPMSDIPSNDRGEHRLLTTATDIIALGVERVAPLVHGIAVVPRATGLAPHGLSWTSSGRDVTLSWTRRPTSAAQVIEVGTQPDATDVAVVHAGASSTLQAPAASGTFYVRVRDTSAPDAPSNAVAVVAGCTAAPSIPIELTATRSASLLTLRWSGAFFEPVAGYRLEAGRTSGASDIAQLSLGPDTTFTTPEPPAGTYVLRVRAWNTCGVSAPSGETVVTIGSGGAVPSPPGAITAAVTGRQVALAWTAVSGATSYRVEVGSARGLADLATLGTAVPSLGAPGVPAGQYFVRARALSAAGSSAPGPDTLVVVP